MKCGTVHQLLYPHLRGYKCVRYSKSSPCVLVNGSSTGSGSYLSVYAQLMRGEYDNKLAWPFEGDIRVELLNWRQEKDHHSYTIWFNRYNVKYSSRVIKQETAICFGSPQFISHTDLAPTTNTEYLLDDYLKLRISVVVYSIPILPLIPWQGSTINTQSGAQFTISEYSKRKQFNNRYYSPPFTTSPQGYKLCLKVYANGSGSGNVSHLSIYAFIMKGQHDDLLQWPFTGTIIIELINWLEDKGHYKKTISIDTNNDFVRVTEGEYGKHIGYPQFIAQSSVSQYLYKDFICIRVQAYEQ